MPLDRPLPFNLRSGSGGDAAFSSVLHANCRNVSISKKITSRFHGGMGLSGTRPADTEMVRISGVWSVLFIFVLLRILRVSGSHSKVMEVTLDELALDLLLHVLSDVARVILAIAPLDDADDANDCDDGNDDDEAED